MSAAPTASAARAAPREHFADRLVARVREIGSPVCIGLDPVFEKLPAALRGASESAHQRTTAIESFCTGVLDAVKGVAPVVKIQSACFERYPSEGVAAMVRISHAARRAGFLVILDAKRGDIGVTAEHYAAAAFDEERGIGADALTVNAYLGMDTLAPYLAWPGRGMFVLVRTSNPGSDATQSPRLADGRTIAEMMADEVARIGATSLGGAGHSSVGAVVAATKPEDAAALRARMPRQLFLVPGYGAQGGTPESVRALFNHGPGGARDGAIVTASRSVLYPDASGSDWQSDIRAAAMRFADELRSL